MRPFPQTLLECSAAPRSGRAPAQARTNQPRARSFVAEAPARGPQVAVTCASDEPRRARRLAPLRAATPCPSTKAAPAKQARNSLDEDQKTDAELLPERPCRRGHILQTCLATRDQQGLHRPCGEQCRSGPDRP